MVSEISSSRDRVPSVREIMAALDQLNGRGEGDSPHATMLRVLWLRSDHADARISTELTHLRDDLVVFHAVVALANDASSSGYAAEPLTIDDEPAATIERGETRAIGRALDILGYVVPSRDGQDRSGATASGAPINADLQAPERGGAPRATVAEPAAVQSSPPMVVNALRNVSLRARGGETRSRAGINRETGEIVGQAEAPEEPATTPSSSERATRITENEPADDLALEDYSWTHFWKWARTHELANKEQVEKRLGHSIDGRTPADVRAELHDLGIPL